ncbi:MAG: ThiF family adenylyltransferase [Treponema sp.]|jgi:tRNA A37 threonylcarbamoyladenosine dehydratase|nr:ThiF family adenylyltransferase [Treponema sp.]
MNPLFQRLALMAGSEAIAALDRLRVIVFGVGSVGSWSAEALARSGVGLIAIVDSDTVCGANINGQVQTAPPTIGKPKSRSVERQSPRHKPELFRDIFEQVFSNSSVGMARKLDPVRLKTADIWDTHGCPFARLVRYGLRKRGFDWHFIGRGVTVTASAGMILADLAVQDVYAKAGSCGEP